MSATFGVESYNVQNGEIIGRVVLPAVVEQRSLLRCLRCNWTISHARHERTRNTAKQGSEIPLPKSLLAVCGSHQTV